MSMTQLAGRVTDAVQSETALAEFQSSFERTLMQHLECDDELHIDGRWTEAFAHVREYCGRSAKRIRPKLLAVGWSMATGQLAHGIPSSVRDFAAGLEILHAFMLIHDDVADRATSRRGGPALQHLFANADETYASQRHSEDLAVLLGDHLYARAVEVMLSSTSPAASKATRYMLAVCRHTAVGQFLDLDSVSKKLDAVTLFQTLKVAHLKTARYGFVAPLVAGAMLGHGTPVLLEQLEKVGRQIGIAFQLQDDLLGLFGRDQIIGKDGGGDYYEGKRTFPLIAAWNRADATQREQLELLWNQPERTPKSLDEARALVKSLNGIAVTERVIARMIRGARKTVEQLPTTPGAKTVLDDMLEKMAQRSM
jgi:geranylgeranyl diphosphate synthase, type I